MIKSAFVGAIKGLGSALAFALANPIGVLLTGVVMAGFSAFAQNDKVATWIAKIFTDGGEAGIAKAQQKLAAKLAEQERREGIDAATLGIQGNRRSRLLSANTFGFSAADAQAAAARGLIGADKDIFINDRERTRALAALDQANANLSTVQAKGARATGAEQLDALRQQEEALNRLREIETKRVDIRRQQLAVSVEQLQKEKEIAGEAVRAAEAGLKAKQDKVEAARQEFGMASAMERQMAFNLAKQMTTPGMGLGSLDAESLKFVQSKPALFGEVMRQQAGGLADQAGFGQLSKQLGLTTDKEEAALREAQAISVQVEQKITQQLQANEKALADEMVQRMMPLVKSLVTNVEQTFKAELGKFQQQLYRNDQIRKGNAESTGGG